MVSRGRTNVTQVSAPKLLSQDRPEYMVPKCRADTIVSGRKSVMALMMLEQWQRQFIGTVMRAVVHEQIPGIGN
jgi:hypothetical protein